MNDLMQLPKLISRGLIDQTNGSRGLIDVLVETGHYNISVCAPDSETLVVGHSTTARDTIVVKIKGTTTFELSGTPANCVSLSLFGTL
jgi:5'-nucleotidase